MNNLTKSVYFKILILLVLAGTLPLFAGEYALHIAILVLMYAYLSTAWNILGGLTRPSRGTVRLRGIEVAGLSAAALARVRLEHVGFVFQAYNLLPVLSALENAEFTLLLRGVPEDERRRRVLDLFGRIGMTGMEDRRPSKLSGGQQQRVAVARALANSPAIILADEPTGNLDTASGASIMQLLSSLHRSGRTVVVVTHDARMTQVATHVVHLLDGRIVEEEI